mmetsp:Transcript_23220/g.39327  ORF Transcript_23220/g.39327 Transcript_23220/m.39327 type:complete len:406 (-) Transcript_23220:399-1616(-)
MGSGISTQVSLLGRRQRSQGDEKSSVAGEQRTGDVFSPSPTTLPYLNNRNLHNQRGENSAETSAAARDRFKRVMHMVRKEAMALDALNAGDLERRKRLVQERMTESMKLERDEAAALRRNLLAEAGLNNDYEEGENELISTRRMLMQMLGDYDLSSSEDEAEEEEHDINHPLPSSDASDALITPTSAAGTDVELWALKDLKVEVSSRTSEVSSDGSSYHIDGIELDVVVPPKEDNSDGESVASDLTSDDNTKDEGLSEEVRGSELTSESDKKCQYVPYSPRRSSLVENSIRSQEKQKQHALHNIMRQESLQERRARANRRLQRRKQKEKQRKMKMEAMVVGDEDDDVVDDEAAFQAHKKVKKEYKAYDHMRRSSAASSESRQRESLVRRLEKRRLQLQEQMLEEE